MKPIQELKKIIFLTFPCYLCSLLFSWPVALLFGYQIEKYAGSSLFLKRLEGGLDALFFSDFLPNADPIGNTLPVVLPLVLGYIIVQILLSAGVMNAYADQTGSLRRSFVSGVNRFGPRFALLFLIALPVFVFAAFIVVGFFSLHELLMPEDHGDMFPIYIHLIQAIVLFIAFSAVQVIHYCARAQLVLDNRGIIRALMSPFRRGLRFPVVLFVKYLAVTLGGLLAAGFLSMIAYGAYGATIVMVVLTQLAIFVQMASRVWIYGIFVNACRRSPVRDKSPVSSGDVREDFSPEIHHSQSGRDFSEELKNDGEDADSK